MTAGLTVVIIGAGGHAKVVAGTLLAAGFSVEGLVDADPALAGKRVLGLPVLGGDEILEGRDPAGLLLANGIGSTGNSGVRRKVFDRFKSRGFSFVTLRHPAAVVSAEVGLAEGAQVMAGAVIQPGCRIGANSIVNTGARIDHDCRIGDHAHIAPGAVLCGTVTVGDAAHVGAGAVVVQNIVVGNDVLVAAGATVTHHIDNARRVAGTPAREMKR